MSLIGCSIFSSDSHFVLGNGTIFRKFGRESPKEHFFEIILKSSHWPARICRLKILSTFSSGCHLFQRIKNHFSNLDRGSPEKLSV